MATFAKFSQTAQQLPFQHLFVGIFNKVNGCIALLWFRSQPVIRGDRSPTCARPHSSFLPPAVPIVDIHGVQLNLLKIWTMPGKEGDEVNGDELHIKHNHLQFWIPLHGVHQDILYSLVVKDGWLAEVEFAQNRDIVGGKGKLGDRGEAEEEVEDGCKDGGMDGGMAVVASEQGT